jgi:hypothetical protein
MPKGVYARKPRERKQYPAAMVQRVSSLYASGRTIREVAEETGSSYKVIWRLMEHHGIPRRVAAKRDQRGERNHAWKDQDATYTAFHHRVESLRGKPQRCEQCGTEDKSRTYEWANLTGDYPNPADYRRMCRQCHRAYDGERRRSQ